MTTYQIEQTVTAVILWEGEARDEQHALELMAQAAGYADHAAAMDAVGYDSGIVVREVERGPCSTIKNAWRKCSPHCPGWGHGPDASTPIQACDLCQRFQSDDAAAAAHDAECACSVSTT